MNASLNALLRLAFGFFALLAWQADVAVSQEATATIELQAATDHEDAIYRVSDTVTFTILAKSDGKPLSEGSVVCHLSKDGVQAKQRTVAFKDGKATVESKLDEPGFLLLRASVGKTTALASAGFDPLQLKPSMSIPEDFQAFWESQKSSLAAVPMQSKLTPVESPAKGVDAFDVQVDCLGAPVSGYFGVPRDAIPKSLPAILFVHGAGVRSANLGSTHWAKQEGGMLAMDINAHGIPNGKPAEYYEQLAAGELKDYRSIGREDRNTCYFNAMFLRLVRAIDFLVSRPEWDGKTLIVYGSSQGGFQAFAAAGIDPRVTFICAGVPAGCDHTGMQADRISGWPKIVPVDAGGKPNHDVLQAARYFDCVNFALVAKCKGAAVTVGFVDGTCPPTSVYAAYNALSMPKAMHTDVLSGHTSTPAASKFMQEAAYKHVREMKVIER